MYRRDAETFQNPVHLVRPLTVNANRRLDRTVNQEVKTSKHRPRTSGNEQSRKGSDFQSNSTSTNFSFGSDCDTDIDDEINEVEEDVCLEIYKRVCREQKIVPVRKYLDNYKEEQLSLHYYGLGPRGMQGFIPSLTLNQCITKLDLSSNGLGDEGVQHLAHILRDNVALKDVNLSQNFIGPVGVAYLCDLFKNDHININHWRLDGNLFNDECARLLAEVISNSGKIYTLNLARNKFGSTSGTFFGQALAENASLQSMDLSWNSINGKGAIALIKGIQKNVYLVKLNLASNGLAGAECGRAWLQAFKENTTLIELDLSHNRLTAEPATYIGRGLAKSESLQMIYLQGNPLESAGCYAILKPLIGKNVEPNKLELIDISEIMVNQDFHELYIQVIANRPELRVLIGLKALTPLLKDGKRYVPTPVERLQTLFQRRPQLDLTNFFFSVTGDDDQTMDNRITDPAVFKQAIQEKLNVDFSDDDIDTILKEVSEYDCKRFIQTFDNTPTTTSLTALSWRLKS